MTIPEHSDDKAAMTWSPTTLEDRLLARYHEEHPGIMFLELPLGGSDPNHGPRRLDGLLVPGLESSVHPQGTFTQAEAEEAITGREVHLLEAKRHLNRNVVGQIAVGAWMLGDDALPGAVLQDQHVLQVGRRLLPLGRAELAAPDLDVLLLGLAPSLCSTHASSTVWWRSMTSSA